MRIGIVCPAPVGSRAGNRVTALRWQRVLRGLGHRVRIVETLDRDDASPFDLLIALHAKKSSEAVRRSRREHPERPIVVALTGTDLYRDVARSAAARRSLAMADRLVVLHPLGARDLPRDVQSKARFVPQSSPPIRRSNQRSSKSHALRVIVVGHLRPVKDPMRIVRALRRIPRDVDDIDVRVTHVGRALSPSMKRAAVRAMRDDDRYRWIGERSPAATRTAIARADVLVLTSRMEGGANVLSEAIASGVAIVASRIASSIGILGAKYPGFFSVGDDRALARILERLARDRRALDRLRGAGARRGPMLSPRRERAAWRALLTELNAEPTEATFRPRASSTR
jgi:putative glycosyltransferase (TIGR04348 family)